MSGRWIAGPITVILFGEIIRRQGRSYNGVGLVRMIEPISKYQMPATESVFHLGTGHLICHLTGNPGITYSVATQLAELGDWSFDSLGGWKNHFPDVREKLLGLLERYPHVIIPAKGDQSEPLAREIVISRC